MLAQLGQLRFEARVLLLRRLQVDEQLGVLLGSQIRLLFELDPLVALLGQLFFEELDLFGRCEHPGHASAGDGLGTVSLLGASVHGQEGQPSGGEHEAAAP